MAAAPCAMHEHWLARASLELADKVHQLEDTMYSLAAEVRYIKTLATRGHWWATFRMNDFMQRMEQANLAHEKNLLDAKMTFQEYLKNLHQRIEELVEKVDRDFTEKLDNYRYRYRNS